MSHTNVTIPYRYERKTELRERIAELEFKLERASTYIDYLEREFANIPDAIKEWGHVDLYDFNGVFLMTVIKKPADELGSTDGK